MEALIWVLAVIAAVLVLYVAVAAFLRIRRREAARRPVSVAGHRGQDHRRQGLAGHDPRSTPRRVGRTGGPRRAILKPRRKTSGNAGGPAARFAQRCSSRTKFVTGSESSWLSCQQLDRDPRRFQSSETRSSLDVFARSNDPVQLAEEARAILPREAGIVALALAGLAADVASGRASPPPCRSSRR